jgi:hypothetical protein
MSWIVLCIISKSYAILRDKNSNIYIYIYTYTFFILNIHGICLRIAYDLEMMHRTIQDIYLKPYSFLTCMWKSKVDEPALYVMFVLFFLFTYIFVSYSFYILLFVFTYFSPLRNSWRCTFRATWGVSFTYWS